MIPVRFPNPCQEPPAPWFVAYCEEDEHFYALRKDQPDFESCCFSSKWQARRAIMNTVIKGNQTDER